MERLKFQIKRSAVFIYKLVKRTTDVAMYAQWLTDTETGEPKLISYEVFEVRKQKARTSIMGGVTVNFKEKELFPNDEAFGISAWSITDVARAEAKFEELIAMLHEKKLKIAN